MTTRRTLAVLSAATTLLGSMAWLLSPTAPSAAPATLRSEAPVAQRGPATTVVGASTARVAVQGTDAQPSEHGTPSRRNTRAEADERFRAFRANAVQVFATDKALDRATQLLAKDSHDPDEIRELGDLFRDMTWAAADRADVLATLEARLSHVAFTAEARDFALCAIAQAATDASQSALVRLAEHANTPRHRAASIRAMHHLDAPSAKTLDYLVSETSRSVVERSTSMLVLGALTGRGADGADPGARLLAQEPALESDDYELWLAAWGNTDSPRAAEIAMRSFRRASTVDDCLAALEAVRQARGPLADRLLLEASAHAEAEVRAAAARIQASRRA